MNLKTIIRELRYISLLKTIYYNYFCRHVTREKGKIVVYKKATLNFERGAKIVIKAGLFFWGKSVGLKIPSSIRLQENSRMIVEGTTIIEYGADILLKPNSELLFGNNSYFNCRAMIRCHKCINIGESVLISSDLDLRDSDGHSINGILKTESVKIGNNVWIGNNVGILKGISIGQGTMIGAKSLITHSIPERCIAFGIPAQVYKSNITWE